MTRARAILLSAIGLLCFSALPAAFHLRPVLAGAQEPEDHSLQSTQQAPPPARRPGRRMDSHTALGLGRLPDAEAAKRGEPLYNQNCGACHGEGARGGIGPNLVRSVLVLHDDDDSEIAKVIRGGRPQAGMPPFKQLTDPQLHDIAEYLHQLVELAANRGLYKGAETMTSGNVDKGKAFFAANCVSCHSVTGDLSGIGTKYSQPSALIVRIAWPAGHDPVTATVTTPEGTKLTGLLQHYDDFETTLQTDDGKTSTWATDSVHVEIPDKLAGHHALLPKYSDNNLHDLTRYLLTIK